MFKRLWQLGVFTFLVGLASAGMIQWVISPYVVPWFVKLLSPGASLSVSVEYIEAPGKEIPGGELSRLYLLKPAGELVDSVDPPQGSYEWPNVKPGWYVVKAYVNDMYVGKTNEIELHSREERREKITTEIARSIAQIEVVSSDGRTPVEGATVELVSHLGILWASYPTDVDGRTPRMWLARTTEEKEYYSIYVHPPSHLKELQVGSVDEFKVTRSRELYTIRLPSKS